MICPRCTSEWSGTERKRSDGYIDYECKCGSKRKPIVSRILVIPDTHYPFAAPGHLNFLREMYDKYQCNTVVHLGDIIDNHYSSYHDTDPDGFGGSKELDKAIQDIHLLAESFPRMFICNGNHDNIPSRKAFSSGLSNRWVKSIKEVLLSAGAPVEEWVFGDHHIIDGVKYTHGVGRQAKQRMMQDGLSCSQGHWHSRSSIEWISNIRGTTFSLQLGALIDDRAYAFAYGKHFADSFKNCGIVIDGKVPIIEYMN